MNEREAEQPFIIAMYLALGHFVIDLYARVSSSPSTSSD